MNADDPITLTLPRHELAALMLYHLNEIDSYEWEADNSGTAAGDLAQLRLPHLQRVEVFTEHMTDALRASVIEQRNKAGRQLLIETVETFLKEATIKQIREIYDLTLALKMRAANKEAQDQPSGHGSSDHSQETADEEKDTRTSDDQVTLALTREEVAALILEKLKEADHYDWLAEDPQDGDTHDLLRLRYHSMMKVKVLDEHLNDDLRSWVNQRLGDERRRHCKKYIRDFLEHMSNDAVQALYDSMLKIEYGRVGNNETQGHEEERQELAKAVDQEDAPIRPVEAVNSDEQRVPEEEEQ